MSLIDKDHPIWKIIQSLVGLAALSIYLNHVTNPPKINSNIPDIIGLIGSGIMGKLSWQYYWAEKKPRARRR